MLFLTRRREGAKARRGLIFTHAKTRRREEEKTKTINGGMSRRCTSIHAAGRKARKGAFYRGRIRRIRRIVDLIGPISPIGPTTKDDDERMRAVCAGSSGDLPARGNRGILWAFWHCWPVLAVAVSVIAIRK
jgi:hypothetical protein